MSPRSILILLPMLALAVPAAGRVTTPYSHGNPTDQEQYLLELINRARANPKNEGIFLADSQDPGVKLALQFFKVDTARMKNEFKLYPARPPLAFCPELLASSRRHSADMAVNVFQGHTGTDGSTVLSRILDSGFVGLAYSENIYSDRVFSPFSAHAGFNIDWGPGDFGVLPGVPHRLGIMNYSGPVYREIGIGVVERTKGNVQEIGKFAVTQDFGIRALSPDFLVGVAYYDVNKDGICDPGEGIPGVKVLPSVGGFHAVTSSSGGYAVPFDTAPGNATVAFSGGGLGKTVNAGFSINGSNAKVDLRITTGAPFVYLKPLDALASEKGGTAKFRVVRVGPATAALAVKLSRPVAVTGGVAGPADYQLSAVSPATMTKPASGSDQFTVTIPKNAAFADVLLRAVPDKISEAKETVTFGIRGAAAYRTGSPASVAISISQ